MSSESPVRRLVRPNVIQLADADLLISDALRIIQSEIVKFAHLSKQEKSLDAMQARTLQGYIKNLTELSREARERAKQDNPAEKLTDDELLAAMQTLLKKPKAATNVAPEDTED